ncbi:MAG: putative peptidoglycan-binding domain-containing protein, partial [Bilophila wadsworthia]
DGIVGPKTLSALSIVLSRNDARRIVHLMNCMQGAHYVNSGANRFPLRKFCVGGWPTRTYDPGQEVF